MKSEIIRIESGSKGMELALETAENTAAEYVKDPKTAGKIRLLAEESLETVRHMAGEYRADFTMNIDETLCEIRIRVHTVIDKEKRGRIKDALDRYKKRSSISDKIRNILESSFDGMEESGEALNDIGIFKTDAKDLNVKDDQDSKELFVWSMQSYSMSGILSEESSVSDETVSQISSSILANLSDDIRVYVFKDSAELIVQKRLSEESVSEKGYAISPEFERLKKVPVATSPFQVKMVQLLYKGLMKKQKSTEKLSCSLIKLPVPSAPSEKLSCLIYSPKDLKEGEAAPSVLLLHGGAFVFPALPYHFDIARRVAEELRCRVFMPDYDLAPGLVPPLQQEECFSVYRYLVKNADRFGIDAKRIVIMGDSAGGTLCAALTLMLRDREMGQPRAQMLFYPSLDTRLESASMKKYTDVPIVNAVAVDAYYRICDFRHFHGNKVYASPVEADSFEGLPDAYIETAEFDCLHDDGILYANLLQDAGCNVILNETRGTVHAFDMASDSSIREEAMLRRLDFLREVL